jgi:hypothetical protein
MAESADNVAYGAATQAVVAAARAWRDALVSGVWDEHHIAAANVWKALEALDELEARLRQRAPP